ncbi:MAG: hypothetical protein K2I18_05170 [Paramuribaculum sp.]|nr:hypothetical protein [Paramuribaculum sp.]
MIRKIMSALGVAICALILASCAETQEKTCKKIAEAFEKNDIAKATELCDKLYDRLPECTIQTLGDLTLSYFSLTVFNSSNSNEEETYAMMQRTVECYDAAMKKNPTEAKALWNKMNEESLEHGHPFDLPMIADAFRTQLTLQAALEKAEVSLPDTL